jgi:hypothetical protein
MCLFSVVKSTPNPWVTLSATKLLRIRQQFMAERVSFSLLNKQGTILLQKKLDLEAGIQYLLD